MTTNREGKQQNRGGNERTIHQKNKAAEVLGTTSVEEQICNPIDQQLGVSSQNNIPGNV
jgi:hypothetical protein